MNGSQGSNVKPPPGSKPPFPIANYFVSTKNKLVYCPIQKVACSSIKIWWVKSELGSHLSHTTYGDQKPPEQFPEDASWDYVAHDRMDPFVLWDQWEELGMEPFESNEWFRFVFVRNPWARLVSCFLNRMVSRNATSESLIDNYDALFEQRSQGVASGEEGEAPADWRQRLTFRKFVRYLANCDLDHGNVDHHWLPQYRFLGETQFHFVGRFEQFRDDFAVIRRRTGSTAELIRANRTEYFDFDQDSRNYADYPVQALLEMPKKPDYRHFYTPELKRAVAQLYARDIEQFGYTFDQHSADSRRSDDCTRWSRVA
jgi:hypothetical protein